MVELLLQRDYQADIKPKMLGKALIGAAKHRFFKLVQRLISISEVDINFTDTNQRTPLMHAFDKGHINVRILLCVCVRERECACVVSRASER